ncbi:cell division protein FtsQ [Kaistella sp. 97-N-M2]|uniref:cell division protein FtsQ/DivIB n=1 Tax=Kaistella sp. 97-N-M2 TaxID=2908645 RepID=UPI001F1B6E02|nr:cell division protein FtsQ [Kaistella sp. 97-N-M2]UJF30805.1 cell division protein FtsQ [Kaistella sp. 97-N-M2]
MKNKFRILKILITVIIFGFLLSFSLKRFNNKPMEKVSVNLTKTKNPVYFIDEKDVKDLVKKSNPTKRIGDIDIPDLEKKLNQLPAVDSANVYLNLNGNLNLDIKQRVPAFRLNKDGKDFYVDEKGNEFPTSKNYSYPCMLVTGNVKESEYEKLADLVNKIDHDEFSKKYFIGISKEQGGYNLLTSQGNYKVEIGDLDRIHLKVKGFKTFVEKYLIYQQPEKYTKISVKYDNQIVTTLNPNFAENDSIINVGNKELAKLPIIAQKKADASKSTGTNPARTEKAKPAIKKAATKPAAKKTTPAKPKTTVKKETAKPKASTSNKTTTSAPKKPKAKVKIE